VLAKPKIHEAMKDINNGHNDKELDTLEKVTKDALCIAQWRK
jgi:hypothetical protein